MSRQHIILCLAIFLLFGEANPAPIRQLMTGLFRKTLNREVRAIDLGQFSVPPTLPRANSAPNELSDLPSSAEKQQLQLSHPLPASSAVPDVFHTVLITETPTPGITTEKRTQNDLDNIKQTLRDLLQELDSGPTNQPPSLVSLEPISENLMSTRDTVQQGSMLETGAYSANKYLQGETNMFDQNVPALIAKSTSEPTATLSKDESTLPTFLQQQKTKDPTTGDETGNWRAEQVGQARAHESEHSPPEDFLPPVNDMTLQQPQGLPGKENLQRPLFGTKEKITLRKVMEKARNMPQEYDDSHTYLVPERHESLNENTLQRQDGEVWNNAYMTEDRSQAGTGSIPVEPNVSEPKSFLSENEMIQTNP